MTLSNSVLESI